MASKDKSSSATAGGADVLQIVAGVGSGGFATVLLYPLDLVKVCFAYLSAFSK